MRRYFTPIIIIGISSLSMIFYFMIDSTSTTIARSRPINLSKSTLLDRNYARRITLFEKYKFFFNSTAFKINQSFNKTMIFSCKSNCHGWGARIQGITSVYILALLTNRRFMIDMKLPCEFLKGVQPNLVNWTYVNNNDKSKNRTRLEIDTMLAWDKSIPNKIPYIVSSTDFVEAWSSYDDILFATYEDYMTRALHNIYMLNKTRKLFGQLPLSDVTFPKLFAFIFELLFTPSFAVRQQVDSILSASYNRHLTCLHIRIGRNPTNPFDRLRTGTNNITRVMIDFTDNYILNKSSTLVFVTSDSGQAISDVLQHYPNSSLTLAGPIVHIDKFDPQSLNLCDGFIKVIADFYILGECQAFILSNSGFSLRANLRRNQPYKESYMYHDQSKIVKKLVGHFKFDDTGKNN